MSFRSYTTYDCTVPDTTELHSELKSYSVWDVVECEHDDGLYKIHFAGLQGLTNRGINSD